MTLDQTHSLFLKNSQLANFPETVSGRKTNKPKGMKTRLLDYFQNICISGC